MGMSNLEVHRARRSVAAGCRVGMGTHPVPMLLQPHRHRAAPRCCAAWLWPTVQLSILCACFLTMMQTRLHACASPTLRSMAVAEWSKLSKEEKEEVTKKCEWPGR